MRELENGNHHHEKGDKIFEKSDRAFISRRLRGFRNTLDNSQSISVAQNLPAIDPKSWPNAVAKVDRLDIKAQFIICMIPDNEGGAFVGTEDHGAYWYKNDGNIVQFQNELADPNSYALCIDKQGRLWSGNLNSGVSVFNGQEWRNYDVIDGPIGERIYDIKCCAIDGDVWIATSAGITRYRTKTDSWEHITREDGLLEDQASSLAFKNDGSLIVGTQCHGIAVFNRNRNGEYSHEKNITAPERFGPGNVSPVPLTPNGNGLPTNQINQILVAQDETVWIATPTGLVKADKNLSKLQHVRGKDYADKVRGLYNPPFDVTKYLESTSPATTGGASDAKRTKSHESDLLPEDYVTCLAEDENGTIWIGTRQRGFMAIDPETGRRGTGDRASMGMADNYVSSILPMADGMPLIALYIGGVRWRMACRSSRFTLAA